MSRGLWHCAHCDERLLALRTNGQGKRRATPLRGVVPTITEEGPVFLRCPVCAQLTRFEWRKVGRDAVGDPSCYPSAN